MLMGEELLFVHFPRAAGTTVGLLLQKLKLAAWTTKYRGHVGVQGIDEVDLANRTSFGVLRPPASWYGSVYLHCRNRKTDPADRFENVLRTMLGPGDRTLADVIECLTMPRLAGLDLEVRSRYFGGNTAPFPLLAELDRRGIGLWSWMVLRMFARRHVDIGCPVPWGVDLLIDYDHLEAGLIQVVGVDSAHEGRQHPRAHRGERQRATEAQLELAGTRAAAQIEYADGWLMKELGLHREAEKRPAVILL